MMKEVLDTHQRNSSVKQAVKRAVAQLPVVIMEKMRITMGHHLRRDRRKHHGSTPSRRYVDMMFCAVS
jgi:transketolase